MQNQAIVVIRNSLAAASAALELLETVRDHEEGANQPEMGCESFWGNHAVDPVCCSSETDSMSSGSQFDEAVCVEARAERQAEVQLETLTEAARHSKFDQLMTELNNPRWRLRTLSELGEITGLWSNEILSILDDEGIDYVQLKRISDDAPLIGLSSRN